MTTKRKRSALPRVTLLAYSRRDLLQFVESVESLRHEVADLRLIVAELRDLATARRRKPKPVANGAAAGEGGAR